MTAYSDRYMRARGTVLVLRFDCRLREYTCPSLIPCLDMHMHHSPNLRVDFFLSSAMTVTIRGSYSITYVACNITYTQPMGSAYNLVLDMLHTVEHK